MTCRALVCQDTSGLTGRQIEEFVAECAGLEVVENQDVLVIVPDGTRTAPVELVFLPLFEQVGRAARHFDVIVALGTHPPMSEEAICRRLGIPLSERHTRFAKVRFFNHAWNNPAALMEVGRLRAEEVRELTHGLFELDVRVEVNRLLLEYDLIFIIGPVFPHEVIGFSGGNKYLFPGVSGPEILNFFHWLGAVITTPRIIGHKHTPVRAVVDRAAQLIPVAKRAFCMVVEGEQITGLFYGTPESAWSQAADLSAKKHIVYKKHPYWLILSRAPEMYDDLWVGAKCMYKLEPVLADGGELIIYAPHIREVSYTHGKLIMEIGYHCRDYFLKQWDRFKHYPWGILAHSTHLYGQGTFDGQTETPRARVTLATQIPEEVCRKINLGYRDPKQIRIEEFMDREDEGILYVPKAGETLYRLESPPSWALPWDAT